MKEVEMVFIVPFVSEDRSGNWNLACLHLEQTIASIFNSQDPRFAVVVAGNDEPAFGFPDDERFSFVQVGSQLLSADECPFAYSRRDKVAKVAAAWQYAKDKWECQYAMKVDADDFISSRLVGWVASQSRAAAYVVKNGWAWRDGAKYWIERFDGFDQSCGTSVIVRSDLADLPVTLENHEDYQYEGLDVVDGSDSGHLLVAESRTLLVNNRHSRTLGRFREHGYAVLGIPFSAAIYRVGNIHSLSRRDHRVHSLRMWLGRMRRIRLITSKLRQEFMIPKISLHGMS